MNKFAAVFCMALLALQCHAALSSEKCRVDIKLRFTDKVSENALGATRDMGIFEVVNQGKSAVSIQGWRWKGRFFVEFPESRLEAGSEATGWREIMGWWIEDRSAPPDKLVLTPGSKAIFDVPLLTARSQDIQSTDKIRLRVKLADRSCIISEPFANPYHSSAAAPKPATS